MSAGRENVLEPAGRQGPVHLRLIRGRQRRQGDFPLPDFAKFQHPFRRQPVPDGRTDKGLAVMKIQRPRREFLTQGVDLVRRQAGGDEKLRVRLLEGKREDGAGMIKDQSVARPHRQRQDGTGVETVKQIGQVGPDVVWHARGKTFQHMVGKHEPLAGKPDFRGKIRPGIKPELMGRPAPRLLGDLLHHRQPVNEVGIGQRKQPQFILPRVIEELAIADRGHAEQELVKTVAAPVHPRDVAGQAAVKFEVQRPQQHRQLLRMRIQPQMTLPLLHHLIIRPVDGFKRQMFHRLARKLTMSPTGAHAKIDG